MTMQQLILLASDTQAEQISDHLSDLGAVAVTFADAGDNPIFEPELNTMPLWEQTYITALFMPEVELATILIALQLLLGTDALPEYRIETVPQKDWERVCMDEFKPMQYGQRLWICPSWTKIPDPAAVNIILDPGLAFGTGSHQTTSLCLTWLAKSVLKNKRVIDYGCGSGILAIAAAKLGAKALWAVDIHPQALEASFDNATKNNVADTINIMHPRDLPPISCDVLLANILAGPLLELASSFAECVVKGGDLVLSGILEEQVPDIIAAYESWFSFKVTQRLDEWCLLHATKKL